MNTRKHPESQSGVGPAHMEDQPYPVSPPPIELQRRDRRRRRRRSCRNLFGFLLLVSCLVALLIMIVPVVIMDQRVNILILGLDRRPGEGDAVRADTIMVLSAKASTPELEILSIPRDLYLNIPGQGENRINTAHIFGELAKPGDGPDRTARAITENFGIPLHGWVRVDFQGYVSVVDVMGGVEIDVPTPIYDDAYPTQDYGYMTVNIPAGLQTMDGERALQYARSRHASTDFDRAARQQQVVQAIIQKLREPRTWTRLPALLNTFASAIETDSSWTNIAQLAVTVIRVGPEEMNHLIIDQDLVEPYTTPRGAAVLLPRWERIRPLLAQIFEVSE